MQRTKTIQINEERRITVRTFYNILNWTVKIFVLTVWIPLFILITPLYLIGWYLSNADIYGKAHIQELFQNYKDLMLLRDLA